MGELTIEQLVNCFNAAKSGYWNYVGIKIHMDGFPKDEIIINQMENFDSKLDYYKKTYDENLNHKFAQGIKIVGFTYGDFFSELEDDLKN
jgi:hypothetical protein